MAQAVGLLIDAVVPAVHADPDRVCLTGFSYGGSSTWVVAQQIPDRFAAIAPCDGRRTDNPAVTESKLKHVAIYLTAGDNDGDFTNDARIMSAGLAAGGHPNFVYREWHGGNHFVYCSTYSDPIFWTWLQGQKRAPLEVRQPTPPPAPTPPPTPPPPVVAAAKVAPDPPLGHLVIDEKAWPAKPGYFSLQGNLKVGDQSRPFTTGIFLPQLFASSPQHLPVVVSLQNHGQTAGDHAGRPRPGLATLLRTQTPATHPTAGAPTMNLASEAKFIALIPHMPAGADWKTPGVAELLNDLIEQTIRHYNADEKCLSLTGIGNGGTAAWSLATALPQRFAAIAVLDAGAAADPKTTTAALPQTGVYLAVGEKDTPLVAEAERMHEALTADRHRDFVWAVVPVDSHSISENIYQDPRFWSWLLAHRRT
jgi:predicted peptidase